MASFTLFVVRGTLLDYSKSSLDPLNPPSQGTLLDYTGFGLSPLTCQFMIADNILTMAERLRADDAPDPRPRVQCLARLTATLTLNPKP